MTPPNPARDLLARYFELKAISRLGYKLEKIDSFELRCFGVIEAELAKQRELEIKRRGKG